MTFNLSKALELFEACIDTKCRTSCEEKIINKRLTIELVR